MPGTPAAFQAFSTECALIGVSPFDYLQDVLLRVATHPHHRIDELTPKGWAATVGRRTAA